MNKIIIITVFLSLSGCSTVDKVKQLWPRDHDPAMVTSYINLELSLEKVDCKEKTTLNQAIADSKWLNKYAQFRDDPQKISTEAVMLNLTKALEASEPVCNRWVNLSKISMQNIKQSWSSR